MSPRSDDLEASIRHALERQAAGDLAGAATRLQAVLLRAPEHPAALHILALVRHQQGDAREAVDLLERAVRSAPRSAEVWNDLGGIAAEADPERAIACFRRAVELAPDAIAFRGNLAVLLEQRGRLAEAVQELRDIVRLWPTEEGALGHLAGLLRATGDPAGSVLIGKQLYALRPSPKLKGAISRSYFLWFDQVDRDPAQARSVLAAWLAFDPDDPIALHMHAAWFGGDVPRRASDGYVERHFDEFSATFETTLKTLAYSGPELIAEALASVIPTPTGELAIVDLGCGTGLVGRLIRPWARRLVGIDLSEGMLALARAGGGYDELVRGELTQLLKQREGAFDLATAADTLIYFGGLEDLFAGAAGALRPGGRFIATIELLDAGGSEATFALHEAGRYAHAHDYVVRCLDAVGLAVERRADAVLRIEYGVPVRGQVLTARRR